jgi:hypothetical protein
VTFLSDEPSRRSRFHKQPTLTFMSCSANSHPRISSSVASGSSAIRWRSASS